MKANRKVKKLGEVEKLVFPVLEKYERLGLTSSPIYGELKNSLKDKTWVYGVQNVLTKVENSRYIFSIVSEITKQKSDQKILEMFSEIDAAGWLIKGAIDGKYDRIVYIRRTTEGKSPDFAAYRSEEVIPIEVKMLSPQDTAEDKFVSKIITKLNDEAIPQLMEFGKKNQVASGLVLIWTHHPIRLEKINYHEIQASIKQRVTKPSFRVGIFITIYNSGIWDFHLP